MKKFGCALSDFAGAKYERAPFGYNYSNPHPAPVLGYNIIIMNYISVWHKVGLSSKLGLGETVKLRAHGGCLDIKRR